MEIIEKKLTKENLLKIKEIDDTFYKDTMIDFDWYLERYKEIYQGIFLQDGKKIVGYLVTVPIKKELYETITNGVIMGDTNINPSMFIASSNYYYIVSCVILEEYRHQGYGTLMMEKLFQNANGKFCALTISTKGYYLAQKFLNLKMKINDRVSVFEKEVE